MTVSAVPVWCLSAVMERTALSICESILEPHCSVLNTFEVPDQPALWRLEGYTEDQPDIAPLQAAISEMADALGVAAPTLEIAEIAPRDWVAENLESFPPIEIGRYFVHGSHSDLPPPNGRIALEVDSGGAFGSGRHESTSGCLAAFDALAVRSRFSNMLDMGCGSAILAMAMARTWNGPVLAVDIDARSIDVAKENVRINAVADKVTAMVGQGYASRTVQQRGPYDLIVANILARPLRAMSKAASRHLATGGYMVLAGLLTRDWRFVYSAHQMQGLNLVSRLDVGEWSTLVLKKGR